MDGRAVDEWVPGPVRPAGRAVATPIDRREDGTGGEGKGEGSGPVVVGVGRQTRRAGRAVGGEMHPVNSIEIRARTYTGIPKYVFYFLVGFGSASGRSCARDPYERRRLKRRSSNQRPLARETDSKAFSTVEIRSRQNAFRLLGRLPCIRNCRSTVDKLLYLY